jgi:hypothetical protein
MLSRGIRQRPDEGFDVREGEIGCGVTAARQLIETPL